MGLMNICRWARIGFLAVFLTGAVSAVSAQITLPDDSLAGLLHRDDVQTELKMTESQKKKWRELDRLATIKSGSSFENDPIAIQDPEVIEKRDAQREKKVWAVLTPDQNKRLMELTVQRNGPRMLASVHYQDILGLTEDQRSQVRNAKSEYSGSIRDLIRKRDSVKGEIGRLDPKKVRDVLAQIEKRYVEALDLVMDQDQRNQLATMGGKLFKFSERRF